MARKSKMTGFAKFLIVIAVVGTITYFGLQQYGNPFNENVESAESTESVETIESVENTETEGSIGLKDTYTVYVHGIPDGNLALRNRELSVEEHESVKTDKKLNEQTYIKEIPTNEIVELIDEDVNSFYIKTKDGTKGFISKEFGKRSTLIKLTEK
jgi:hypothetical protein